MIRFVLRVVVENAGRFARDLIVQETGYAKLGITLIAADDPNAFTSDTPTATLVRQILGAVAQFEKPYLWRNCAAHVIAPRLRQAIGSKVAKDMMKPIPN